MFGALLVPALAEPVEPREPRVPVALSGRFPVLAYGSFAWLRQESLFNPQNMVAGLANKAGTVALRPEVALVVGPLRLAASPRAMFAVAQVTQQGLQRIEARPDARAAPLQLVYLHQGAAQLEVGAVAVGLRRAVLRFGPAVFTSPSNPFLVDDGRTNPKIELGALDFAEAVVALGGQASAQWLSAIGPGRDPRYADAALEPFVRTHAAKVDLFGSAASGSIVVSVKERGMATTPPVGQAGGFAQWTVTDSWLLYTDLAAKTSREALVALQGPAGWEMVPATGPVATGLLGTSVTAGFGPTVSLEVLYNGAGYSPVEAERYYTLATSLSSGAALNPRLPALRRHYLTAQVSQVDLWDRLDVLLRATASQDGSAVASTVIEAALSDRLQLFTTGALHLGPVRSEFGRLLHGQLLAGVEAYVW